MIERTRMAFVLAVLRSVMLGACGGGGGGGGSGGGGGGSGGGGGGTSLSGNANLSALTVTGADLEQGFDPGRTSYTAVVGFLIDSIQVDASAEHSAATVEVDGAAVAAGGVTLLLAEGDNDIVVEVTAEDGTTRSYTVTVTRQSADAFAQDAYVKASNTGASDLFGRSVALSGDTLAVGAFGEASTATGDQGDNTAPNSGAVYVFTRDGAGLWSQQAYVKASNTEAGDQFGYSVALSGDTLAVGAFREDSVATGVDDNDNEGDNTARNSGAAYVFTRDGAGLWSQQAYVKASNTGVSDEFGRSVALSGDTLAVGALGEASADADVESNNDAPYSGAAYVFTRDGAGLWSQQAYVKASNTEENDEFGSSVALSGDTLAVGAFREASTATGIDDGDESNNDATDAGAVYVFTRDGAGIWEQDAYVKASNTGAGDQFGISVALSGDTLSVGAYGENSAATGVDGDEADNNASGSGAAYVFTRDGAGVWSQQAYVKASNTEASDVFGSSVALSGDTLAVGAFGEDSDATSINGEEDDNNASRSGAVYVFKRDGAGDWEQQAYVKASNTGADDFFGHSVALSGDTLAVGANLEDSDATGNESNNDATDSGAVYVFTRDGTGIWSQQAYVKASNAGADDHFGSSVALSGDTLAVGADGEDSAATGGIGGDNAAPESGAVYVFTRDGAGAWSQQAYVKASNTDAGDLFGDSVALSGETLAVGAYHEDSAATGNETDNTAPESGAVYVFTRDGAGDWEQQAYVKASNTEADDRFGYSVALSGDTLAVGALEEDSAAIGIDGNQNNNSEEEAGAAYVFD